MLERVKGKVTLLHCCWEYKLVQPLWRTVWKFLRKLKIELPYDPAILLLGIYPDKTVTQKDTCSSMFIAALFAIPKTSKCLLRLVIDNESVLHIYNGLLLSHRNEWNNAIGSNRDATRDYHTRWRKRNTKPYDITYMWNLKYGTNESVYETESGTLKID